MVLSCDCKHLVVEPYTSFTKVSRLLIVQYLQFSNIHTYHC
nr:MAG TPA: hypothetical protein [Caudoviricetes sp.]